MLVVKGKQIGCGKPLVCVPIIETEKDAIVAEAERLQNLGIPMIEWRVDAFSECENVEAVEEVLRELSMRIYEPIVIFTFRTSAQGGQKTVTSEILEKLHLLGASSPIVDFVDVEYYALSSVKERIDKIHRAGSFVIGSHHDFLKTPDLEELMNLLEGIRDSYVDIVKLAVMPKDAKDVLLLLQATEAFHSKHANIPVITMSMNGIGGISRVCGEFFGSCVTFGAGEKASAPGQLPMKQLDEILSVLHESMIKE